MLVRGTDRHGHFDDEPRPRIEHGVAEQATHAEAVARFRAQNTEEVARYEAAK
jgi:non-haem Fe2+, alpha-ketoglutarate-dependent halogenase